MPAHPFTVHVDHDDLARQDIAAAVTTRPSRAERRAVARTSGGLAARHGAEDERLAARQRSERQRSSRAGGQGQGRTYAFRRS